MRIKATYDEIQEAVDALNIPTTSPVGMEIWVGNLGALNDGRQVGQWVGLPIDEAEMDAFIDAVTLDGTEYILADATAPTSNLSSMMADMTPQDANAVAIAYNELPEQDKEAFLVAMGIPDFQYYRLEEILEWIEGGEMYLIDDLYDYLEEWLPVYFTQDELVGLVMNQTSYEGIMLLMYNDKQIFNYYEVGAGRYLIFPI